MKHTSQKPLSIRIWKSGASLLASGAILCSFTSCQSWDYASNTKKSTIIGGAGGAVVGAAVSDNKAAGALVGGALGAGGGYLFGKNRNR